MKIEDERKAKCTSVHESDRSPQDSKNTQFLNCKILMRTLRNASDVY